MYEELVVVVEVLGRANLWFGLVFEAGGQGNGTRQRWSAILVGLWAVKASERLRGVVLINQGRLFGLLGKGVDLYLIFRRILSKTENGTGVSLAL